MIAGTLGRRARDAHRPLRAVGEGGESCYGGELQAAWKTPARALQADGVTVVLDGFLTGATTDLGEIAQGWREAGEDVIDRVRGGFTLLIWDRDAQRGLVACDPFSLRVCLVHGPPSGPFTFSTHMRAMRAMLATDPSPEPEVLIPWLAPHHLQGHKTMLSGVERLGGARMACLHAKGWQRRRYWQPSWTGTRDVSAEESVAQLSDGLRRAIALRLPGGGSPTATILSGGVDSSVVLATATQVAVPTDLRAYSTVFPDWPAADESARITATAERLGVPARRFTVKPQGALRIALEQLHRSGTVPGGPGGLVERPGVEMAASEGVKVLLDGQGGDELFGSSPYLLADLIRRGDALGVLRLLRRTVPYLRRPTSWQRAAGLVSTFGIQPGLGPRMREAAIRRGVKGHTPPDWLRPQGRRLLAEVHDPWPWLTGREHEPRWWAYHSHLLTDHFEGSGLGEHMWERAAPFGMRSAAPLFDIDLVELVLGFPPARTWQSRDRPLARAAMAGVLPEQVRANPRKANIGPFYLDLITGPDNSLFRELLLDPRSRVREFADPDWIEHNAVRMPVTADPDWLIWITVMWRLVMAECWLRWLEDPGFAEAMLARDDLPSVDATRVD